MARASRQSRNSARALIEVEASRSVFHSQQAAEKAIKGFLTFHQIAFRKTHNLTDLGSQCASGDPSPDFSQMVWSRVILRERQATGGHLLADQKMVADSAG